MKKFCIIICILLTVVFAGTPAFFALAGETEPLGDSTVSYTFDVNTGTLTLSGTGATPDYTAEALPPFIAHRSQIRKIQVNEGITALGNNLFRQLSQVTEVHLPHSLIAIGQSAFFHAAALEKIQFPAQVQTVGSYAFAACSALTKIEFADMTGSLYLGACAFIDCKALAVAQFPVGTSFGQYAVGYLDEDGRPMNGFTLRGLSDSTAAYYAAAATHITFDAALELTYAVPFGHIFQAYTATDWYRYTPAASGTYHFYSVGAVDTVVRLCDQNKKDMGVGSDDRSLYDLNFDLTCQLQAGQTYYFKVTNNHSLGGYTAYLHPGKVTGFSASFPQDMVLLTGRDSSLRTDAQGTEYAYFDLNKRGHQLQITVTYDTGDCVTLPLTEESYNGSSFTLTDTQAATHWTEGTYFATLTWGKQSATVAVQVHTHSYTAVRTEPTCLEDGQILYTCTCGDSYSTLLPKLGHTSPATRRIEPTCEQLGYTYTYCTRCYAHLSDAVPIPALGHIFTSQVIPATPEQDGCVRYTCTRCGYSYDTNIQPALRYTITGYVVQMELPDGSCSNKRPLAGTRVEFETRRFVTDDNGHYSIPVAPGTYQVRIGADFLPCRTVTVTVEDRNVDLGVVAVMPYDMNQDGYVNARDFVLFQQYAADVQTNPEYYERLFDFNRDGKITLADMDGAAAFVGAGKPDFARDTVR